MNIKMQAVNFTADKGLGEYLEKKMDKINQFYDKIIGANVYFKLENVSEKQNKTSEIVLLLPGDELVVKKQGQSFEECIDLSVDTLKKMIIKRKEKSK